MSGASKSVYALEPFDVGQILQAEVTFDDYKFTVSTTGPVDPGELKEIITVGESGRCHPSDISLSGSCCFLNLSMHFAGKMRMKLRKERATIAKDYYFSSMQLCGVRGCGNAAAQALFWQAKSGLGFVLAFESERDRNAAIMLAQR